MFPHKNNKLYIAPFIGIYTPHFKKIISLNSKFHSMALLRYNLFFILVLFEDFFYQKEFKVNKKKCVKNFYEYILIFPKEIKNSSPLLQKYTFSRIIHRYLIANQ